MKYSKFEKVFELMLKYLFKYSPKILPSKYLTDTFGKGFSEANLKNMRQFYLTFPEFDTQCVANLSWTNIRTIIRISNKKEREYYLKEASTQNWSYRLERKILFNIFLKLLVF